MASRKLTYTMIGLSVGAVTGFLTRPSYFMVDQLPFMTVITRGAGLAGTGLDEMAKESFNHLFWFTVLGGIFGFALPAVISLVKKEMSVGDKPKNNENEDIGI